MSELSDAKALEKLHPTVKYICQQLDRVVEQESELALLRSQLKDAQDNAAEWALDCIQAEADAKNISAKLELQEAVIEAAKKWKKGRDVQILIDALDVLQKSKETK